MRAVVSLPLLPPLLAGLFFAASVLGVVGKREELRAAEQQRQEARRTQHWLNDEWRNLQLEYATQTGYARISAEGARLQMAMPQAGTEAFVYLPRVVAPAAAVTRAAVTLAAGAGGE